LLLKLKEVKPSTGEAQPFLLGFVVRGEEGTMIVHKSETLTAKPAQAGSCDWSGVAFSLSLGGWETGQEHTLCSSSSLR